MITRMDRDVGRILDLLGELGIDSRTAVFFSSDNGPHAEGGRKVAAFGSSGPFRGWKRDLYEGGIRVPMIVRWPGRIAPRTVSRQVWAHWDFLPTAAALAGVAPPAGIDGVSMLAALVERGPQPHPPLYWEFHERGFARAVREGRWKGIRRRAGEPLEVYDLEADPGELRDLARARSDVARRLEALLAAARQPSERWKPRSRL
jgi:arylsulfatase A-like enzyme